MEGAGLTNLRLGPVPLHIVNGYGRTEFTVEGTTPDALVEKQPLRFAPPTSPAGSEEIARNSWRRLQFALDMASPYEFSQGLDLSGEERAILERFRVVALDLGDSAVINERWNIKATFRPGQEDEVGGKLPSNMEMAGFAAYLRQCDGEKEKASFTKVQKVLGKALVSLGSEEEVAGRKVLKSWRRARAYMKQAFIDQMIVHRLAVAGQVHPDAVPRYPWTPAQLMKMFHYGELIHWGDHKDHLSEVFAVSPGHRHYIEFRFLEAAQYFGHFYVGVTALIDRALADG